MNNDKDNTTTVGLYTFLGFLVVRQRTAYIDTACITKYQGILKLLHKMGKSIREKFC